MFQNAETPDKPCGAEFYVHTIFTEERITKWKGDLLGSEVKNPYKITSGKVQREVNMYFSISQKVEIAPDRMGHRFAV